MRHYHIRFTKLLLLLRYSVHSFVHSFVFSHRHYHCQRRFLPNHSKVFYSRFRLFLLPFSLYRAFIHLFWVFDSEWASVCHWTCQPYKSFEENVDAHYAKTEYIEWFTEWIIWWGMRWNCSLAYGTLGTGNTTIHTIKWLSDRKRAEWNAGAMYMYTLARSLSLTRSRNGPDNYRKSIHVKFER